jgi:TIR domain
MRLFFPLSGDDVFISYSRRDGALYAAGLADKLTEKKLSCFIDKLGTEPNHDLPPSLKKKIKNCTVFVLVGTEKATQSEFVKKEIAEFKQTGRTILPIDFGGNVAKAIWYEEIPGLAVETEKDAEAFETGNPSQNVTNFVEKSFNYTRRNQFMSRMFWGALSLFFILIGLGVGSYLFAQDKADKATEKAAEQEIRAQKATEKADAETLKANKAEQRATEQENNAKKQEEIAKAKETEAKNATSQANKAKKLADEKNKLALEKTELANEKTEIANAAQIRAEVETKKAIEQKKIADEQTRLADIETKRANKQQSIAEATQLSNEANNWLNLNNPAVLKNGFDKAIIANQKVDTNGLALIEPISSLRRILSFTSKMMQETSLSLSEMNSSCDNFVISTNQTAFACRKGNEVKVYQVSNPEKETGKFNFNDYLIKQDVKKNLGNFDETSSAQCLSNTDERTKSKIYRLSVSDDGKVIAIAITDEDEQGDDIHYSIVVKNLNQQTFCEDTDNVQFLSLSPNGESLIYADINSSQGDLDLDINRLNLWRIESDSEILDCNYSSQLPTMINGSFSPDGKRYVTLNNNLSNPSVTEIHEFLIDKRKKSAGCTETPLADMDSNTPSEYFLRSYDIYIGYISQNIAVNNSGNRIAVGANGVSVWEIYSNPQLKTLIPPQSSLNNSLLFIKNPSSNRENIITLLKDKTLLINQTWSIEGYVDEDCQVCGQIRDLSELNGFSETHPDFKAEINGTTITILRKNDSAVIDYIDFGEAIEENGIVFSQNGSEIITKSYDSSPNSERGEQLNGYRDYNYKKWKIGYTNLVEVIKSRLPLFDIKSK